jgi:hypothetical protein
MENLMKKLTLCLAGIFLFSAALYAQTKPAQNKPEQAKTDQTKPAEPKLEKSKTIQVTLTSISLEKYGPQKEDVTFKAKETVYVNLEIKGLKANDKNQVAVQADLSIPQLGLDRKNLIDGATDAEEAVPMYFSVPIGSVQQGGFCNVKIIIRDMIAKTYIEFETTFNLAK